jgi:hypothetical protein
MNTAPTTATDIITVAIAFALLGIMLIAFGLWSRGRVDSLLIDPKLGDRFDDEEHEYRANAMFRSATWIVILGVAFVGIAIWLVVAAT